MEIQNNTQMKTKEQVFAHLKNCGYRESEISKIMGFLIGNGTKAAKEPVYYRRGVNTFDDFLEWYQSEPVESGCSESCPICTMFKILFSAMDSATEKEDLEMLGYLDDLMNIMLDTFIEDAAASMTNEK